MKAFKHFLKCPLNLRHLDQAVKCSDRITYEKKYLMDYKMHPQQTYNGFNAQFPPLLYSLVP